MNKTITATLVFTATATAPDNSADNIDDTIGSVKWQVLNQIEEMFFANEVLDNITITVE